MFKVLSVDNAKTEIYEKYKNVTIDIEEIEVYDSLNRHLVEDIYSSCNVPHFRRSTVDGYALISSDISGTSESMPVLLKVIGEQKMGEANTFTIENDECMYVPTGGMLPEGADSVVMIEDTDKIDDNEILVLKPTHNNENVINIGEDIKEGTLVLKSGHQIRPQDVGVLTSIGIEKVKVYKKINFSVISTGDEILMPHEALLPGKIRDINTHTISSLIKKKNHKVEKTYVINDDKGALKLAIIESLNNSDVVLLSGGSSVGNKDLTYDVLEEISTGCVFIHGLAIKPGKPTIFAEIDNKIVIGLPGQPASALMVLNTFIDDIKSIIYKVEVSTKQYIEVILKTNIHSAPGRESYHMVKYDDGNITPVYGKSGLITLLSNAYGYIVIDENSEGIDAGTKVRMYQI